MWECFQARDLWQKIQDFLNISGIYIEFTLKIVLFDFQQENIESLTLSPMAYRILWLLSGGASEAPPLKVIEGVIFERGHENRK